MSRVDSFGSGTSGRSKTSSEASSKHKFHGDTRPRLVAQELAIPYGDTQVLKSWLRGKYGGNFRIRAVCARLWAWKSTVIPSELVVMVQFSPAVH
jgi:hypothetical protein